MDGWLDGCADCVDGWLSDLQADWLIAWSLVLIADRLLVWLAGFCLVTSLCGWLADADWLAGHLAV